MKNNQDLASLNTQLFEATLLMGESHVRWIEAWTLTIAGFLDEVPFTGCTTRLLQTSQSVIQVMKSLLLFRLTLIGNWNMVQCRMDKARELILTQLNTVLSKSAETEKQLEEVYCELTASILQMQVRMLESCASSEEEGVRMEIYRQIGSGLDIAQQWRVLDKHYGSWLGAASRKLQISEICIREFLRAILDDLEHKQLVDRNLQLHVTSRIQRIESGFAQPSIKPALSNAVALHNHSSSPPSGDPQSDRSNEAFNAFRKEQATGKIWINKGLKSPKKF